MEQPDLITSDPRLHPATLVWAREERLDLAQRVKYLNILRTIVGRRMPSNLAGHPLVSDFDLRHAKPHECEEALNLTTGG